MLLLMCGFVFLRRMRLRHGWDFRGGDVECGVFWGIEMLREWTCDVFQCGDWAERETRVD